MRMDRTENNNTKALMEDKRFTTKLTATSHPRRSKAIYLFVKVEKGTEEQEL